MTASKRHLIPVLAALMLATLACTCGALGRSTPTPTPDQVIAPTEDTSGQPTAESAQPTDTAESQAPTEAAPTKPPIGLSDSTPTSDSGSNASSPFPLPDDAKNVLQAGGTTNFQTAKSLKDMIAFYQDAFKQKGYKERTNLHIESTGTFSIVFDGDPSGQATVVQGVDLGNGTTNINVRLESVP